MKKFNFEKFKKVFTYLCLAAYVCCVGVLVVEASMDGTKSANQSNTVGGGIADIINNGAGDTSVAIEPTEVKITNKIETAYVGDTYQLNTSIIPEDSTFQSLLYSSSSSSIATISDSGYINFLKEGVVDFTIQSSDYPTLTDTFTVKVLPVNVESIDVTLTFIQNGNEVEIEKNIDNKYDLYLDTKYKINVSFLPTNATYKNYDISYLSSNFTISNNQIIPSKTSSNYEEITIESEKKFTFAIKIIDNPATFVPFTSLDFKNQSYSPISLATMIPFSNPDLLPKYNDGRSIPTYKEIEYISSNPSVAKVTASGIKAVSEGSATITLRSVKYPEIYATRVFNVVFVKIDQFKLFLNSKSNNVTIEEGVTGTLKTSQFSPSNYSYNNDKSYFTYTYTSSNPSVVSVTNQGKIKALSVGTSTVTLTIEDKRGNSVSSSINITVKEKPAPPEPIEYTITNINYSNSLNEINANDDKKYLFIEKTYNFDNYFTISSIEGTNTNIAPKEKQIKINSLYSPKKDTYVDPLEFSSYVVINGNNFKFLDKCIVEFYFIHTDSNFTTYYPNGEFTFRVTAPVYIPYIDETNSSLFSSINEEMPNKYNIDVKVSKYYTLTFPFIYGVNIAPNSAFTYKYYNEGSQTIIEIGAKNEGKLEIKLVPSYEHPLNDAKFEKTLTINSTHITISDLNYTLKLNDEELISQNINENHQQIYQRFVGETLSLDLSYNYEEEPTSLVTSIESSDNSVVKVTNEGKLKLNKAGKSLITIKDKVSNIEKIFQINAFNIIKLDKENSLIIKGKINKKDSDGTFHFYTASSIKITPNFTSDSTFKQVKYSSLEDTKEKTDKILEIGEDGSITTIQKGNTEVYLEINDGFTPYDSENLSGPIKLTIKIQVDHKTLINEDNISNFLYLIRKSLGHFGAFFVLGICSTFFFMLQFDKEKWFYSIPINFLQGLSVASLTELIQVFVPGRAGLVKDVLIDYSGFAISALVITIAFLAYYFIKKAIKKHKEKNNK